MIDWASSGRVKIERANKHIRDLVIEIESFEKRNPYLIDTERNKYSGTTWRVRVRENPPLCIGAIAGDALHNLRSALDILWRQFRYPKGGGEKDLTSQFPILTAKKFEKRFPKHGPVKPEWKPVFEILHRFKPYEDGNDLLWMLQCADAADKHRLLIPVYAFPRRVVIGWHAVLVNDKEARVLFVRNFNEGDFPVKDGTIVYESTDPDVPSDEHQNPQVALDIAFGEVEAIKRQLIVPTLLKIREEVEGVAEAFLRAGLIR